MPDSNEIQSQPALTWVSDKNCPVATLLQLDGDSRRAMLMSDGRIRGGWYGWTHAEPIKPELIGTFRDMSSDKQSLIAEFMGTAHSSARAFKVVAIESPSTRVVTPVLSGYDATSLQHTEVRLAIPPHAFETLTVRFEGHTASAIDAGSSLSDERNTDLSELFALQPGVSIESAARTLIEQKFFLQAIANPDSRLVTATFRREKRSLTPAVEASLSWIRG